MQVDHLEALQLLGVRQAATLRSGRVSAAATVEGHVLWTSGGKQLRMSPSDPENNPVEDLADKPPSS